MRRLLLALLIVPLALPAFPPAAANLTIEGDAVVEGSHPHGPQVFCGFVFDTAGEEECLRDENVVNANVVRVRSDGRAHVIARVLSLPSYAYIGQATCFKPATVCEAAFWSGAYTGQVRFWVTAYDALPGALVVTNVETDGPLPA